MGHVGTEQARFENSKICLQEDKRDARSQKDQKTKRSAWDQQEWSRSFTEE